MSTDSGSVPARAAAGSLPATTAGRIDAAGGFAIAALAFAVPISTALANVALVLVVACWVAGGSYRAKLRCWIEQPVALAAVLLFAWLCLSLLWAGGFGADQARYLRKYADLPLVAVFLWFCLHEPTRERALQGFAAAMLLTLALSCAAAAGVLPAFSWLRAEPGNAVVFKLHITHGLLMALAALLFHLNARAARRPLARVLWSAAAALALFNVLFMVQGRTGYLVIAAFVVLACAVRFGWRGLMLAAVAVTVAAGGLYQASPALKQRVDKAIAEFSRWDRAQPAREEDSVGRRLEFYSVSSELVRQRPLLGYGLGNFPAAYRARVEGSGWLPTSNPHNEYLLLAVQAGLPAVALFLHLLARMILAARGFASERDRTLALALPVWLATGCLVNALLIDHTESLLFALLAGVLFARAAGTPSPVAEVAPAAAGAAAG